MKHLAIYFSAALFLTIAAEAKDWWNKEWTIRKKITVDTSAKGGEIAEPIGSAAVLVRLHDGNFQFTAAMSDGSDLRFVAEDGKTLLPYHIERYDGLLNEAFVWVKLPEIKSGAETAFWLYYSNPTAPTIADAKATYDPETVLVYHFAERNAPPADQTRNGNNGEKAGSNVEGAMIGGGLRTGGAPLSAPLAGTQGAAGTISLWVRLSGLPENGVILSRREGDKAFILGAHSGVPFVELTDAAGSHRTNPGSPLAVNAWHHLSVTLQADKVDLQLDGEPYASVAGAPPALNSPLLIGGDSVEGATTQPADLDELVISNTARPPGYVKFAAFSQGKEKAAKLVAFSEEEQSGGGGGHSGYFGVIVNSLTVDGWIVIGLLGVMAVISWWVMISKVAYLNGLSRGNALFMKQWEDLAADLTALDHGDLEKVKSLGGRIDPPGQHALRRSSVYRIYHLGAAEVRHRLAADHSIKALSSRSIQSIRAKLDGGLVREKQGIDRLIVLLTICISGGPFLGLLGTVVGVMITFAAVAAAGEVNVNAIAPGIAAALLATVAGLAVAIPALFGYNYILSRVKDATADMHVFIDEFTTRMAEFYAGGEGDRIS